MYRGILSKNVSTNINECLVTFYLYCHLAPASASATARIVENENNQF